MPTVETVTGPIETSALGSVLMHEHVTNYSDYMRRQWPHLHDYETEPIHTAVDALSQAKSLGISTVVDCTTPNMGRQVQQMADISARSGMNIVFSTGHHPIVPTDFYFNVSRGTGLSIDDLADLFVHDIEVGAQGTEWKAGIIKVGTSLVPNPWQEKAIRAAARAHRRTGVPITTHSEVSLKDGLLQLDLLEEEGVDLRRVIVGHSGDSQDYDYLSALVARGCYLGMDRFGFMVETFLATLQTAERVEIVMEMIRRGATRQMVLSHDACVWCDYMTPEHIHSINPEWNINYLSKEVIPLMKEAGMTDESLRIMLQDNPAAALTRVEPY